MPIIPQVMVAIFNLVGEEEKQLADQILGRWKRKATPFRNLEKHGGGALSTIKARACTCATSQRITTSGLQQRKQEAPFLSSRNDS